MHEPAMRLTPKELCYTAMMLKLNQIVNVEYLFPVDDESINRELNDVKHSLREKKLLKENSKGEVTLDMNLAAVVILCSKPDSCEVKEADGYYGTIYASQNVYMLIEREQDGMMAVFWFMDREALEGHINVMIKSVVVKGEGDDDIAD